MTDQNDEMPANASKFLELSDELQQTDADRKRKGLAGKTEASSSNRRCSCGDVFEKGDDGYACRSCGLMPKGGLIDDGPAHRHFADDPDSYNKDHHQIVYEPITPNMTNCWASTRGTWITRTSQPTSSGHSSVPNKSSPCSISAAPSLA